MLNFSCLSRSAMLAAAFFGIAGCTARDAGWQRANTSDATRAADYRDCRGEAKSLAGPALGIDQDIAASRGGDWRKEGNYDQQMERNSGSDADAASQILSSCMREKGYRPR